MIPVIDLFAGPGGLGEGFSSLRTPEGKRIFQIIMSVECEDNAFRTLRLRSFARKISDSYGACGVLPKEYWSYVSNPTERKLNKLIGLYPDAWATASQEACHEKLAENDNTQVEEARSRLKKHGQGDWILIGGPPCQAYSLVGRSRRTRDKESLQKDEKQTLYKCYLKFIEELKPSAFVMENVRGILSARLGGHGVFDMIVKDMEDAGYSIHSLVTDNPQTTGDYIVEAERYGIPQARHRVILFGIRNDLDKPTSLLNERKQLTVEHAIGDLPMLRSSFSQRSGVDTDWGEYVRSAAHRLEERLEEKPLGEDFDRALERVISSYLPRKTTSGKLRKDSKVPTPYLDWYRKSIPQDNLLVLNHVARSHMPSDLDRYLFCALYAEAFKESPTLEKFPDYLLPNHKNVTTHQAGEDLIFDDRFRVQVRDRPSTTITSHIAKDGHYFIHYDPQQCRSLTVREAARLQTFPDDYFFEGNRTAQYRQVGNAVPPLLAQQIAQVVAEYLGLDSSCFFDCSTSTESGESS